MASSAEEEVRKRRAKGRPGSPKVYRKLVLLGGRHFRSSGYRTEPRHGSHAFGGDHRDNRASLLLAEEPPVQRFAGRGNRPGGGSRTAEEKIVDLSPIRSRNPGKRTDLRKRDGRRPNRRPYPDGLFRKQSRSAGRGRARKNRAPCRYGFNELRQEWPLLRKSCPKSK